MTSLRIVDLEPSHQERIKVVSEFVFECFKKYAPEWLPNKEDAIAQVLASFDEDRRSRVALTDDDVPVGWIGAFTDEDAWEIHPIAVSPTYRRRGLGRLLVSDIENLARSSAAVSVWAGTSDETDSTSFSKIDLYNNPTKAFDNIEAPDDHPVRFWLGVGYSLVGVIPDEEGLGKPGIHFAKRVV